MRALRFPLSEGAIHLRPSSTALRVCAVAVLAVLFSIASPRQVGFAQSEPPPLTPWRGLIDPADANPNGQGSAPADVWRRSISADGRYAVFASGASDLIPGEYTYGQNIFMRDRTSGTTTRVSVPYDGAEYAYPYCQSATISSNGRHVAFTCSSTDLVPGDTNNFADVFVRDLEAGRTVRVSVAADGTEGDKDAFWPVLSATGRFVAFVSEATTLVPEPAPFPAQAFLHDRDADGNGTFDEPGGTSITRVSVSSLGEAADGSVSQVSVSADGRFVAFESDATNLDPAGNPYRQNHVYMRDRQTGETSMVDRAVTGGPSRLGVGWWSAEMTDDGRYVTYVSASEDIVPIDSSTISHVFRYDRLDTSTPTVLVTALPDGSLANGSSYSTSISGDGRFVTFMTSATNVASPAPAPGTGAIVVRDMVEDGFTRVDVTASGTSMNHAYPYSVAMSADGTTVAFMSNATNAFDGWYGGGNYHMFVVTAFSVSTTSAAHPMEGGAGTIHVNTSPVNGWTATSLDSWVTLTEGAGFGAGPRAIQYLVEANTAAIVRVGRIRLGSTAVLINQAGDGDTTPPVITPIVTGTQSGSGWYTSDIVVQWTVTDPDSEIVSIGPGCTTATFTTDFIYANPTCEATSHGGTASVSVPLQRDTTPPAISISRPQHALYLRGASVTPSFNCNDSNGYSGVDSCTLTAGRSPLDTSTPGWHTFTVTATDRAGNTGSKSVDYLIGTDACVTPGVAPADHLTGWWGFDGSLRDAVGSNEAVPVTQPFFQNAVTGKGWLNNLSTGNYLKVLDSFRHVIGTNLTVAVWLNPAGFTGAYGTIVEHPGQYRIARFSDGTLRWAFNHTTGFDWVNTGAIIPYSVWSHVAITYTNGAVATYVNGRVVHSVQLTGTLTLTGDPAAPLTIGGREGATAVLQGLFDELMIFNEALPGADVDGLARSGSGSLCVSYTSLSLTSPSSIPYGSDFTVWAFLTDDRGNPLPNRTLALTSHVGPDGYTYTINATTGANGMASAALRASSSATLGSYAPAISAGFAGEATYRASVIEVPGTLVAGTPVITWAAPANIAYGTPLGDAQLNATTTVAGTFTYSPPAGTVLDAGTHTLTATFTPDDPERWVSKTASTGVGVTKGVPVMTVTGGTFTYDGNPHAATASAIGGAGEALAPLTITYNGAAEAPVNAGTYEVVARFAGDENHTWASATGTLTIVRATPAIDVSNAPLFYNGQPRQATVTVTGLGGVELYPYTVLYDGASTQPVDAGTYVVHVRFEGNANYAPASVDGTLVINKTTPIMGLSAPTLTYDGQPHAASASAIGVNNEPLTPVVITYDGSATVPVNAGVYAVEARYEGSANYTPVSQTTTLTITKADSSLAWAVPSSITYGTPLGEAELRATAAVPGTFDYSPPAGTVLPAGSHQLTVAFTPSDSVNYHSGTISVPLTVNKAYPGLTWPSPADIVYGTPLGEGQLNATSNVPGTFSYWQEAGTLLNAGTHALRVTFIPDDSANYHTITGGTVLRVNPAAPTVTWAAPAEIVYGTALGGAQLNASANVSGTFAYSPAAGTILAAGVQTLSVTFTPTDANYAPATATTTLNVLKATPTIAWPQPGDIVYGTALGSSQLNATSSVSGALVYTPAAGTVLGAGVHTLSATFTPYDTSNYGPATATVTVNVRKAASIVAWTRPQTIVYGAPLGWAELDATADVPGTFAYTPPAGTVLEPGADQTLSVTFTPDDAANYEPAAATTLITVVRATPVINWPPPAAITYGTPLGDAQLNATANVAGTFEYTPAAGAVLDAGAQTLSVTFTPADPSRYTTAALAMTLTVDRRLPVIIWDEPAPITYGTPLSATELDATADVPGTFTYSPAAWSVLEPGVQTLSVAFRPNDTANYYTHATASTTITVQRATPVITWPSPEAIVYGTPLGASQLNATANVPGTFAYSPATGAVVGAGVQTLTVTFTPSDETRYTSPTATVTLNVAKAVAALTWPAPSAIVYGTPLGATQLNATASTAGTFEYSPPAGTVLNAGGGHPLSVTFTPADTANYVGASASTGIAVNPAPLTVRATDAAKRFGAPLPPLGATIAGFVNGDAASSLSGTLALTTSATQQSPVGTYAIVPSGVSSPNYAVSFLNGTLAIVRGSVDVTLAVAPEPSGLDQPMTFTASVAAAAPAAGSPAGTVRFFDGAIQLGSAPLEGGTAKLSTAGLDRGVRTIEARYDGDGSFEPGSASGPHVIRDASETPALTLASSRNPSNTDQSVTLTATVSMPSGDVNGLVEFYSGNALLGTSSISAGRATFTTSSLPAGSHAITARYVGSAEAPPSRSGVFVQAVGATGWKNRATSMAMAATPNPATLGDSVVLTADVTGSSTASPTGRILFMVNGTAVAEVVLSPLSGTTARASVTVPGLAHGRHSVTATYLGDPMYKGSTAGMTATVN